MIYDIRLFIFQFMFDDHQKDDNDIQWIEKYKSYSKVKIWGMIIKTKFYQTFDNELPRT